MWYVIQTITGKEEELILQIRTLLKKETYHSAFLIKAEWQKRLGGAWQVQVKPLFPGYVFIETEAPEAVFQELKRVPNFSRLLEGERFEFTPVEEAERDFLLRICQKGKEDSPYFVRRSTVKIGEDRQAMVVDGPLIHFKEQIERVNIHKRYAVVRIRLCHREQTVLFGVRVPTEPENAECNADCKAEKRE